MRILYFIKFKKLLSKLSNRINQEFMKKLSFLFYFFNFINLHCIHSLYINIDIDQYIILRKKIIIEESNVRQLT